MTLTRRLRKNFNWLLAPAAAVALLESTRGIADLAGANLGLAPGDYIVDGPRPRAHRPPPFHSTRADAILARNPFDSQARPPEHALEDPSTADDDPTDAPPCDGVRVSAIVSGSDPEWSLATFEAGQPPAGRGLLRRRGGEVGAYRVEFIAWDRVWLTGKSGLCLAPLFAKAAEPAPPTPVVARPVVSSPPSPLEPWILKGIETVSPTQRRIDRGLIPRLLERQAELVRPAQVVPELANGKVVAIRVTGVTPGSLLGTLGLVNGDRLQSINGFDLTNPQSALEAYTQLQNADRLVLQLNRGGSDVHLELDIR